MDTDMKIELIILIYLLGCLSGYILKDVLTTERKVTVNIKKQKVKGENNTLEAVTDIEVDEVDKRKGLFSNWKGRKLRRNKPV